MHDARPGRAELWGLCGLRRGARGAWACGRAWGAEALLKTHIKRPSSMSYVCGVWRFYGLLGWPRGEGGFTRRCARAAGALKRDSGVYDKSVCVRR